MRVGLTVHSVINLDSGCARSFHLVATIDGRTFRLRDLSPEDVQAAEWTRLADVDARVIAAARDLFPAAGPAPGPLDYDLAAELLAALAEAEFYIDVARAWASGSTQVGTEGDSEELCG